MKGLEDLLEKIGTEEPVRLKNKQLQGLMCCSRSHVDKVINLLVKAQVISKESFRIKGMDLKLLEYREYCLKCGNFICSCVEEVKEDDPIMEAASDSVLRDETFDSLLEEIAEPVRPVKDESWSVNRLHRRFFHGKTDTNLRGSLTESFRRLSDFLHPTAWKDTTIKEFAAVIVEPRYKARQTLEEFSRLGVISRKTIEGLGIRVRFLPWTEIFENRETEDDDVSAPPIANEAFINSTLETEDPMDIEVNELINTWTVGEASAQIGEELCRGAHEIDRDLLSKHWSQFSTEDQNKVIEAWKEVLRDEDESVPHGWTLKRFEDRMSEAGLEKRFKNWRMSLIRCYQRISDYLHLRMWRDSTLADMATQLGLTEDKTDKALYELSRLELINWSKNGTKRRIQFMPWQAWREDGDSELDEVLDDLDSTDIEVKTSKSATVTRDQVLKLIRDKIGAPESAVIQETMDRKTDRLSAFKITWED